MVNNRINVDFFFQVENCNCKILICLIFHVKNNNVILLCFNSLIYFVSPQCLLLSLNNHWEKYLRSTAVTFLHSVILNFDLNKDFHFEMEKLHTIFLFQTQYIRLQFLSHMDDFLSFWVCYLLFLARAVEFWCALKQHWCVVSALV